MFNEEGNVAPFVAAVVRVMREQGVAHEIVLVDDGSHDATWQRICEQAQLEPHVRGLSLSRNFGHQNALFAGMSHARGQAIITMDGDLQHPPAVIPELLQLWRDGYQVVTTTRDDSPDTGWFKRLASRWFYRTFSRLTGVPLSRGASDFRLVDARTRDAIVDMRDSDIFLRGIVSWLGFRSANVRFQADPRHSGNTKYSLKRMLRLSAGAMVSFSMLPLRMGIWLGLLTSLLAFVQIGYAVIHFFRGNTVPGWASVMVLMSLMFSVAFVLLGSIGLYLGKIYEILKGRQRFVVAQLAGFADTKASQRESSPSSR